jgi:16S rRNA (guanine(527)-N(7))-methyltransferase RsmG
MHKGWRSVHLTKPFGSQSYNSLTWFFLPFQRSTWRSFKFVLSRSNAQSAADSKIVRVEFRDRLQSTTVDPDRIAELLRPYIGLAQEIPCAAERLFTDISIYIDLLIRWNARMNLTAIRDPEEIVTRHFGESLFAARYLFPSRCGTDLVSSKGSDLSASVADGSEVVATHAAIAQSSAGSANTRVDEDNAAEAEAENKGNDAEVEAESEANDAQAEAESDEVAGAAAKRRQNKAHGASRGSIAQHDQAAEQRKKLTLADLGSGAGFPGIPIKLWAPDISLTLIESNQKKSVFLREVSRALTLTDIDIQNTRAEDLRAASFDVVTLRAVEKFQTILPTAASLVGPHGRLVLLLGSAQLPEAKRLLPRFTSKLSMPIPNSRSRCLLVANPKEEGVPTKLSSR